VTAPRPPEHPGLVLVVDDDVDIVRFVQMNLQVEGFEVVVAHDGLDGYRIAREHQPDLAIVDLMMPGMDGLELTRRLRADPMLSLVPVIMLTARGLTVDKVVGLTAGADDYVIKPFDTMELMARVQRTLRRNQEIRQVSPLTGLPGNNSILREVGERVRGGDPFAVCHIDIDRFKSVNDVYGFGRGDEFITALADSLHAAAIAVEPPTAFLGHIGGDDFVVVCHPDQVRPLSEHTVIGFESAADQLYDPIDAKRGYLEYPDRKGNIRRINLVTLSIGVALSTARSYDSAREIVAAASEMKTVAKSQPGSYVAVDRRRNQEESPDGS
jgi:diguanylate cyclase (GGDEF)-like protein